jgi:protein involved in polysaccharide export with SLBB domain
MNKLSLLRRVIAPALAAALAWPLHGAAQTIAAVAPPASAASAGARATPPAPAARPTATDATPVFGSQIFGGRFAGQSFTGFNPDYQVAPGDRISVRLWGAYALETTQAVDAQGNIFLPNVGPVRVQGVRNLDLNAQVQQQVKRVFRANVNSYASLEGAQPVT